MSNSLVFRAGGPQTSGTGVLECSPEVVESQWSNPTSQPLLLSRVSCLCPSLGYTPSLFPLISSVSVPPTVWAIIPSLVSSCIQLEVDLLKGTECAVWHFWICVSLSPSQMCDLGQHTLFFDFFLFPFWVASCGKGGIT